MSTPLHKWVEQRIGWPSIAAVITVFVVTVTFALPAIFVTRAIGKEAVAVIEEVRGDSAKDLWDQAMSHNRRLSPTLRWIEREANIRTQFQRISDRALAGLTAFISSTVFLATFGLVSLFLLFYFLRDREYILGALRNFFPLTVPESSRLFVRVRDTIQALVWGTLAVSAIQGTLGGLMFWWLGLPAPLLWGAVMAIVAVLPVFGTALIWVPTAVYLAFAGEWQSALILTVWGGTVIALIDNLLYPFLVRNKLRLHPVPIFIAILGGLLVFGGTGIVLGPVILAIAVALLDVWRRRMADGGAVETAMEPK
jgi:predicted PurR-regulated permease PerM